MQVPSTTGILVEAKGECTLDFVASEEAFAGVLPRLLAGYEGAQKERPSVALDHPNERVAEWITNGVAFEQPAVGVGTDLRIKADQCLISALLVEDEVVALGLTSY